MKNGCSEISEAVLADKNERSKKLYRYVSDLSRRVGEATAACRSLPDLFSTNNEVQRQKLRDNCEKLLFLDPINHGKKSLELLWRKVYYDTISLAKKLREDDQAYDTFLLTHIMGGMGHLHNIITRIQSEMKVQYKEIDYLLTQDDEESDPIGSPTEEELQFGRCTLHSCLIYLGDLSRYQTELFLSFDASIAARYYLQAAHVDMNSGMPYNQLGNLYLDKNYNLDSVCYYIHCLACSMPFEGAMGNLTKIFDKNTQYCDSMNDPETQTQGEHIQNAVAHFLSLIEIWYLSKNDTNVPQRCNTIAQEFKMAMDFEITPLPDINKNYDEHIQAVEEENTNPTYLNGNLVHKIVLICLFTISKVSEIDEQQAFACKAFTLALLSQLLQKLLKHLEFLGLKNPALNYKPRCRDLQSENMEEITAPEDEIVADDLLTNGTRENGEEHTTKDEKTVSDKEDSQKIQNGDGKNAPKKALAKRRRRRRGASSESSDEASEDSGDSETESDDSGSDEALSDSTNHSDGSEHSSSSSEVDEDPVVEDKTTNNEEKVAENGQKSVTKVSTPDGNEELNETEIQNFLLGNNFLPSIKLLQDWVLNEKELILSCGDSAESLFQCVVDLLNIFTHYFKRSASPVKQDYKVLQYARGLAKKLKLEYKTIPLPEDINLRGTTICKFDKDAAEWQILDKYIPTVYEESVIRILDFIDFGDQIAKIVPRIRFNRTMKIFYLKRTVAPKVNAKIGHKKSREWHNSKIKHGECSGPEGGLLRRLGRLWLASRVRELERAGRAPEPALLVLDAAALHVHLRKVKQLLRARNFVLLVPTVVVQQLDGLKRERSTARDAIRWLELQLKSGSRFVRAQRPGQTRPLPLLKLPRKAPPHVHDYIQILEFCNHLMPEEKHSQGGNGDPDGLLHAKSAPLLILLTGSEPGQEEEFKEFSLTGAAHSAGISVQHIGEFYRKWRQTVHKSGKKR